MGAVADSIAQSDKNAQDYQAYMQQQQGLAALTKIYGPIAYTPQQAQQTQNYFQSTQMDPLLIKQQAEQNGFTAAADPLRLQSMGLANQSQAQANAVAPPLDQQKLTANDIANQTNQTNLNAVKAQKFRASALSSADMLDAGVKSGADAGTTFDAAMAQNQKMTGTAVDPQTTAAWRAAFLANPSGFTAQLRAQANTAATNAMTPQEQATTAESNARANQANAYSSFYTGAKTDQAEALATKANADAAYKNAVTADPQAFMRALSTSGGKAAATLHDPKSLEGMQERQAILQAVQAPLDLLASPDGQLQKAYDGTYNLGTQLETTLQLKAGIGPAANVAGYVQGVQHALSLLDLRNLRATGLSLGKTTNTEFLAAADAIQHVDVQTMSPPQIRDALDQIKNILPDLTGATRVELGNMTKDIAGAQPAASGAQQPAAGAQQPAAGAPQPVSGDPRSAAWQQANLVPVITDNGQAWKVNKEAAPAFEGFLKDLQAEGYHPISSGGFNYRDKVGGGSGLSEHATGNAIDINATVNAQGQHGNDFPPNVQQLATKWGLRWGGTFSNPDPMHFEYVGPGAVHPSGVVNAPAPGGGAGGSAGPGAVAAATVDTSNVPAGPLGPGGVPAIDAARAAAQPAAQPNRADAYQQAQQPQQTPPPPGQMLSAQQLTDPSFQVPGQAPGVTVGVVLQDAMQALAQARDAQTKQAIMMKLQTIYGIPPSALGGM